jgi:hypothetical protein
MKEVFNINTMPLISYQARLNLLNEEQLYKLGYIVVAVCSLTLRQLVGVANSQDWISRLKRESMHLSEELFVNESSNLAEDINTIITTIFDLSNRVIFINSNVSPLSIIEDYIIRMDNEGKFNEDIKKRA